MDVYINDMAIFMPNEPVFNDDIEQVLGKVDNLPSKARRIVLKTNGIKRRFYAIDRETGIKFTIKTQHKIRETHPLPQGMITTLLSV